MYKEFSFTDIKTNEITGKHNKFWLGVICSDKETDSKEFWEEMTNSYREYATSHGVEREACQEPSKFTMHRNGENELICSVLVDKITERTVDKGLRYIESFFGGIPSLSDMKKILKQLSE